MSNVIQLFPVGHIPTRLCAEKTIVKFLQERGFATERVPLSGAAGEYVGDLTIPILDVDRVVEVKCRAGGFRELYRWLIDRDILIVRADRSEPMVVLPVVIERHLPQRQFENLRSLKRARSNSLSGWCATSRQVPHE